MMERMGLTHERVFAQEKKSEFINLSARALA